MVKLTEYDVLLKICHAGGISRDAFMELVREDARFGRASRRVVYSRIRALKDKGYILESGDLLEKNAGNPRLHDLLAFIYWSIHRSRDYNTLLEDGVASTFAAVLEGGTTTLDDLTARLDISKPTALRYVKALEANGFIRRVKEKPLNLEAQVTDHTLYYINLLHLNLDTYQKKCNLKPLPKRHPKKLMHDLIRLHTYSTTVTEGNTATVDDVKKVLENLPVKLTPKETIEIVDAEKAVEKLITYAKEDITEEKILELHATMMKNLLEKPGRYHYGRKRIIGSQHKPPQSREVIDSTMKALTNFTRNYAHTNPQITGPMTHLLFVSIHPFRDGNGRIARLLHSWILLKNNKPLFAYDPHKKNQYFNNLEKARNTDIREFIQFSNNEHIKMIESVGKKTNS